MPIRAVLNGYAFGYLTQRANNLVMIPFGLGLVAGTGQAPWGLWVLTIAALAIWLGRPATSRRTALRNGWLFGAGYFAVALHWIVSPFLVDIGSTGWMAPFALVLMAGGAALFWGLANYAAYRISPQSMVLPALMIAGAEVLRSYLFTGFPWALLGHIWIDTPLAQLAAFGGPHLLTLLTVVMAAAAVLVFQRRFFAFGIPLAAAVSWFILSTGPTPHYDGPTVRLVQPNANQADKWDPIKSQLFFRRMIAFTQAGDAPDLVVWPETAVSYLLEYAGDALDQVSEAARGAPTVLGINRRDGERYYNSSLVLERGGIISNTYDKAHIVPFGEYIPGGELLARFGVSHFAASRGGAFSAGSGPRVVDVTGIGNARILICYEGIFAHEVGTDVRPRLLILITNDAWFGPAAGPRQHLAQARLRAIEQGLPMVRVANTGISAMIDGKGRITNQIGMGEAGYIDAVLPPALALTIYSKTGDLPALLLLLLCGGLCTFMTTRWWIDPTDKTT
ncbi:MAG: apolipoprotein N-acyltransferase [Reinekea sp.]|jgi:apolipoprotein N-acyltransferase